MSYKEIIYKFKIEFEKKCKSAAGFFADTSNQNSANSLKLSRLNYRLLIIRHICKLIHFKNFCCMPKNVGPAYKVLCKNISSIYKLGTRCCLLLATSTVFYRFTNFYRFCRNDHSQFPALLLSF